MFIFFVFNIWFAWGFLDELSKQKTKVRYDIFTVRTLLLDDAFVVVSTNLVNMLELSGPFLDQFPALFQTALNTSVCSLSFVLTATLFWISFTLLTKQKQYNIMVFYYDSIIMWCEAIRIKDNDVQLICRSNLALIGAYVGGFPIT